MNRKTIQSLPIQIVPSTILSLVHTGNYITVTVVAENGDYAM